MKGKVVKAAFHRNGIAGDPFYVGIVRERGCDMLVVTFLSDPLRTAAFDIELLGEGNIAFGENSFRGDQYSREYREEIIKAVDES